MQVIKPVTNPVRFADTAAISEVADGYRESAGAEEKLYSKLLLVWIA